MSLNILHVNYYDSKGGASIAVERIHESLKLLGINSKILVAEKLSNNSDVFGPSSTIEEIKWKLFKSLNRKIEILQKKKKYDSNSFNFLPNNFVDKINNLDCDIVNLHWIGNNLIPIKKISKIKKPIVWTLHDMWAYTGSEHYSQNERFITGYNKTNRPEDLKGLDVEKYCWNLKRKYYPQKMTIVPTSKWQLENLKKSYLLKNHQIQKIPLPIDFNFWKRFDKKLSRKLLNLPQDKKIILIGSENLSHKRKGSNYLNQIFKSLDSKEILILSFGNNNQTFQNLDLTNHVSLKEIKSDTSDLKIAYSASDLFIAPSIQESFGQTVLEASSCCLPSVCFENNGISEIIDHKINGFIAKENDLNDFIKGVDWCLKNLNENSMEDNLKNLNKKFSYNKIGSDYKILYEKILSDI